MVEAINSISSAPINSLASASLDSLGSVDENDFMENLSEVFAKATENLEKVPGMDGVYCVANPVTQLDITIIDPQEIPDSSASQTIV